VTNPLSDADQLGALPSRAELTALADLTLAEYIRYLTGYGGQLHERDGLLLFAGAHRQPNPYRNGVLRIDGTLAPDEVFSRAERFFTMQRRSYAIWTREHGDAELERACVAAGFRELERLPEMSLPAPPPYLPPPDGVEIRPAADVPTREDYLTLVANAWGMADLPRDVAAQLFFEPDSLTAPNVAGFVAYYDEAPISAAMTHVSHGVALGCQAATIRRPARGQRLPKSPVPGETRGLAQSCLCAALELSFSELGAEYSLCQTSGLGQQAWMDLGYEPFSGYGRYLVPSPVL
jgi:hypothetical protein